MERKKQRKIQWKTWVSFSWKDFAIMCGILLIAMMTCEVFMIIDPEATSTSMVFLFAVFLVSRFTEGYLFGMVASVISIILVNYFFTEPLFGFNFSMAGYPLTISCMLVVAITTGALTTQTKRQNQVKLSAEKEKMRGNLLRAVSHDIRTPLTSIMGASSALLDNEGEIALEEQNKLVRSIHEEAQWLLRMVENLLSVTRIDEEHKADIQKTEEAAEEIVAEAVAKFRKRYPEMEVCVKVPDEYIQISVDPILIEQVLINLMENVVHHAGTVSAISLGLQNENGQAVFEVSDDGTGIREEVLPHIFSESFYHNYEESGDKRRNMGIGLSVCQTIVKVHGGVMTAQNKKKPEHGAVFRFVLPIDGERERK